jgi:hypothetical protein
METPQPLESSNDFPSILGSTYAMWTLDGLDEIAYAVSVDFITRPNAFVGSDIPSDIVLLRMAYGIDPEFPNTAQRAAMMMPILGKSDGLKLDASGASTQFYAARQPFLDACTAFAERAVDSGIPMLEGRVRSAVNGLRDYFKKFDGQSARASAAQIAAFFTKATRILRSSGVSTVYGVSHVDKDWPLSSTDPNGALLVQAASVVLPVAPDYRLSYQKFLALQRVAQAGMTALPQALTVDIQNEGDLQSLISNGYFWVTTLQDLQKAS